MQQVTPIMPPDLGARQPRSFSTVTTEATRRDLFAPDPIRAGFRAEQKADAEAKMAVDADAGGETNPNSLRQGGAKYGAPSAILIGEAGANLVLSKLQGWGIPTQIAMPGIAYDLIADVADLDLLRIQVKTRSEPKGQRCSFAMTRGFYYSKAGNFDYARDDFDLAAFVCLSIGAVFFCPGPVQRISVRRAWMQSPTIARDSFDLALQTIRRRRQTECVSWLASMSDFAPEPTLAAGLISPPVPCSTPRSTPRAVPRAVPSAVPRPAPGWEQSSRQDPAPERVRVRTREQTRSIAGLAVPSPAIPRIPAPTRHSPQQAVPDVLDTVDWDEVLAMFNDDGIDAIIPI